MSIQVIQAQKEGVCPICKKAYPQGTRIVKDARTGKWAEADCVWPSKAKKDRAYPIKTNTSIVPGTNSKPGTTLPWPKALDKEQIDRMLESARSKAQEITGEESHPFAVAIFKAQLLAAEQSFSLALSQKVAQEQSNMQENKLRMIKQVKGE